MLLTQFAAAAQRPRSLLSCAPSRPRPTAKRGKKIGRRPMKHLFFALIGALVLPAAALAQGDFPSRPITMIIPFPPGGVADQTARAIIGPLEKELKAAIAIRNVGGAGGAVGMATAANAKA